VYVSEFAQSIIARTYCKNFVVTRANILITNNLSYYMHYYRYPVLADNSENCVLAICRTQRKQSTFCRYAEDIC